MAIAVRKMNTHHRYIVKRRGARGTVAEIKDTGIDVWAIIGYYQLGKTAEQIQAMLPHLTLAQIYDAFSYYYDHQTEIDKIIERRDLSVDLAQVLQSRVNAILTQRKGMSKSKIKERAAELRRLLDL